TEDEECSADLLNVALASELGGSVNAERLSGIFLNPRLDLCAVEDVVGGVMDEERVVRFRFFGENSRGFSVDAHSEIGFGFGSVDRCIRGGVQDDIGMGVLNGIVDTVGIAQVACGAAVRGDVAEVLKGMLQLDSQLAVCPENQKPCHGKTSASSKRVPCRSFAERMASCSETGHGMASVRSFQRIVRSPDEIGRA